MNELFFTALDAACIINNFELSVKNSAELIRKIFYQENFFIAQDYKNNYRRWILDIRYWEGYLYDKVTFDKEFPAIKKDSGGLLAAENFVADNFNLDLFFKTLRIKILYIGGKNYSRMKLRTLLATYGYKRRSKFFLDYVKKCLAFYKIQTIYHGEFCDVAKINLDDMITFRIISAE